MTAAEMTVLRPQGRLDAAATPAFEQEFREHLARGHTEILVDLSDTRYINSSGLRALLRASKEAQRAGGALRLCGLNARLTEIFSMAGFDQLFEIYKNCAQAEQAFQS